MIDKNFYLKFSNVLKKIGIKKGQTLIISADLLLINIYLKRKKISLNLKNLIYTLKETIGKNGNIVFYSFFWDFFKGKTFNHKYTKSYSGSLSNYALLNDKDFLRTKNPVYSMLVWGKDAYKMSRIQHTDCFNIKSPFGYLLKKKTKLLFINLDFKREAFPFFHMAEQKVRVYYRYFKFFSGKVIKNKKTKKVKIKMYVRKKNYNILTCFNDKFEKLLKKNNKLKEVKAFASKFILIDLKAIYSMTVKELKKEKKLLIEKETKSS